VYCCALKRNVMSDLGCCLNLRLRVAETKPVEQQWSNVIILQKLCDVPQRCMNANRVEVELSER